MNVKEAISLFKFYQQSNHRKRTAESYRFLLQHFNSVFSDRDLDSIKPDEIYHRISHLLLNGKDIHQKAGKQIAD